jgi:hypothetical protein
MRQLNIASRIKGKIELMQTATQAKILPNSVFFKIVTHTWKDLKM